MNSKTHHHQIKKKRLMKQIIHLCRYKMKIIPFRQQAIQGNNAEACNLFQILMQAIILHKICRGIKIFKSLAIIKTMVSSNKMASLC